MAASTGTLTRVGDIEWRGHYRVSDYVLDLTSLGADGYPLNAADVGASHIRSVQILGGQETGGRVLQYVPDSNTGDFVGDGDFFVYQNLDPANVGGADVPLAEDEAGDVGTFRIRLELV